MYMCKAVFKKNGQTKNIDDVACMHVLVLLGCPEIGEVAISVCQCTTMHKRTL